MRTSSTLLTFAVIASLFTFGTAGSFRNTTQTQTQDETDDTSDAQTNYYVNPRNNNFFIPQSCINYSFGTFCPIKQNPGCACHTDGTCTYESIGNACTHCRKDGVASFNPGQTCPSVGNNKLKVCTNTGPINCPPSFGGVSNVCECNNQGVCNYINQDACTACNKHSIVSALEGQCALLRI